MWLIDLEKYDCTLHQLIQLQVFVSFVVLFLKSKRKEPTVCDTYKPLAIAAAISQITSLSGELTHPVVYRTEVKGEMEQLIVIIITTITITIIFPTLHYIPSLRATCLKSQHLTAHFN